jgi:hypothetical protein
MAVTGLSGPFALTVTSIDKVVTKKSAGAYALGTSDNQGNLTVRRVGRSDGDLNGRLKDYVGKYPVFKADYFASPKAAFEKECHLYHDFDPPDNAMHPDRPAGTNWTCPRCRTFG